MGGRLRFVYSNKLCTRIDLMRETSIATTATREKKESSEINVQKRHSLLVNFVNKKLPETLNEKGKSG